MLDKRCLSVLDYINKECLDCTYKVFSAEEIALAVSNQIAIDTTAVFTCIDTLSEQGYVLVKYKDETEICVTSLPKGRLIFESRIDGEIEKSQARKEIFKYSFLGSLTGAILGVALSLAVMFISGAI